MLSHCEHDEDCLTVHFQNGNKYRYFGVPKDVYHDFTKAESAGSHFGQFIKGKYKHEKVEE